MSSPTPIHITGLPPASAVGNDDLFVINQSGIDRQLKASFLKAIQWGDIPQSNVLNSSDLVLVNQSNSTVKIPANLFNIPSGTITWFYQDNAPSGWTLQAYSGDALLAVRGGSTYSAAGNFTASPFGTVLGTWQQIGVTLTIQQIPNHQHYGRWGQTQSNHNARYFHGSADSNSPADPRFGTQASLGIVGGEGDNASHNNYGGCQPHNHGNTWRPQSYVGIICRKN